MKKSLNRLVIDSSTPYLFIGLYNNDTMIDNYYAIGHNDHSVKLMDKLEQLLIKHELKSADLDEIIVGIGPGSYTGLRIGVVVAKMLAYSLDIPIYTVSSLALLASSVEDEGDILPWIDARRSHAFLGVYQQKAGYLVLKQKEVYTHLDTFKEQLNDFTEVTQGKPDLKKLIESNLLVKADDIDLVAPIYLRDTEAERNLND